MRASTRRTAEGLAVIGGAALLRPGTRTNRAMRHQVDVLGRHLRHLGGRLNGVSYRLRGHRPDPNVSDLELADRIRSSLGGLEQKLDLPRIHVMVDDQVALLHGEVSSIKDVDKIEAAVANVSGVIGVESYLHVGLTAGDTRPSAGRAVEQPSDARRRLLDAAINEGLDPAIAPVAIRAILATFAERLPEGERDHVTAHLPADVQAMLSPPRRSRQRRLRTEIELVAHVLITTPELPSDIAWNVTAAVVGELRALVPEEAADVAAVLPAELREFWKHAPVG